MTIRPRRSVLYMPGSNSRALEKAKTLPADALILDLEDAVGPGEKAQGRTEISNAVRAGGYGYRELIVRVNGLDTLWGPDDVKAVANLPIDAVLFPKVERVEDVEQAIDALDAAGGDALPIWIMCETPAGVLNLPSIASASPRLGCIVAGTSDLSKEMRVPHTPGREGFLSALSMCVLAARANGLDVLDGVHLDLKDLEGFAALCVQGRELGFDGKTLIHPTQVEAANRAFSPEPQAVTEAAAIIEAWKSAAAEGKGMVVVNGRLIENLHVEEAERMLAVADAIAAQAE